MRVPNEINLAMVSNNSTYIDYLDRLRMLATSIFSWKNLDEIAGFGAERFLEQSLFDFGRACFVNDDEIGLKVFNANPSDRLNTYNLPTKIMAWSVGYERQFDFDEIVYIMNNPILKPTAPTIHQIAYRLFETERTMDVNRTALKTPILLEGDTKQIFTLKQVYEQFTGNTPVMYGNKNHDIGNKISVMKTDAPYLLDKLTEHKKALVSEALNYLGIDNFFSDKKERLITTEAEGSQDLTNYYLNCFYKTRKEACDLINKKFLNNSETKIELTVNKKELMKLKEEVDKIITPEEENE